MYDALLLAAIVDELQERLLDGRVQRVLLLDSLSVGFEIYAGGQRHQLLTSVDAREARLHLVANDDRLTGDSARITPLLLLLRKYVRGARLVRITQEPLERVALLRFAKFIPTAEASGDEGPRDEEDDLPVDGDLFETTLAVEIMGRHSNLILIDANQQILESAKRVPARLSRVRPVLPKLHYQPVPPQQKADPRGIGIDDLAALLAANPEARLHQALVSGLRGLSPQVAREVAYRATGSVETRAAEAQQEVAALRRALDDVLAPLATGAWAPRLYRRAIGTPGEPDPAIAFSPFPLYHLRDAQEEQFSSVSALVERYFSATATVQAHGQQKSALAASIDGERERLSSRERALAAEAGRAAEAERWRRWGEAIYAHAWSLTPGQREFVAEGETIPLDPTRTPSENAQDYFERYRKAQSAGAHLPALLETTRVEIAYLDQLLTLLRLAEGYNAIAALSREWEEWRAAHARASGEPGDRQRQTRPTASNAGRPQMLRARGGHQIYIGYTGRQNDAVTFDIAGPDDSWLHSRGVPGAHVIVKWQSGQQDSAVLGAAAALAAYHSAGREAGRVEVDHAARRDVRKIKGAGPGMVTYRNEETMRVAPRDEATLRQAGLLL